jgi:hypothetical protein
MTIKVLVATDRTQGDRDNDFQFVPNDEVVKPGGFTCDSSTVDDECGCSRSFEGTTTDRAGTTARVAEIEGTRETVREIVKAALTAGGWLTDAKRPSAWIDRETDYLIEVAAHFPVDTIVEKRGDTIKARGEEAA